MTLFKSLFYQNILNYFILKNELTGLLCARHVSSMQRSKAYIIPFFLKFYNLLSLCLLITYLYSRNIKDKFHLNRKNLHEKVNIL